MACDAFMTVSISIASCVSVEVVTVRMLVVINWDGKLKDIRILESSGHHELDDAALRIVRIASPFQDFPVEMRKKYDQLEIIRTWKFSRAGASLDS